MRQTNNAEHNEKINELIKSQADLLESLLRMQTRLELYRDGKLQADEAKIEQIVNGQKDLIAAARATNIAILGAVKSADAQAAEVDSFLRGVRTLNAFFADPSGWRATVVGADDWRRAAAQIGRERTNWLRWQEAHLRNTEVLLALVELLDRFGFTAAERRDFLTAVGSTSS